MVTPQRPYYKKAKIEFEFFPGQSASQKKKNVEALHAAFLKRYPTMKVLEISTKSDQEVGIALSPFNLTLRLPFLQKAFSIENIYQASKVYEHGGPFYDLLGASALEAKRDPRKQKVGKVVHFNLENKQYPANPDTAFYTWLYFRAIKEHPLLAQKLLEFNAFTDIECAEEPKGGNQALACCIYVSMAQAGVLKNIHSFSDLVDAMYYSPILKVEDQKQTKVEDTSLSLVLPKTEKRKAFAIGEWIVHPTIGKGEVVKKDSKSYTIYFKVSGPKVLSKEFVEKTCRPLP